MKKHWILAVLLAAALTGCEATPTVIVPTLIELPSQTPVTPTVTLAPPTPEPNVIAPTETEAVVEVAQATEDPLERATFDALVELLTLESGELATGLAGATETALALTPTETLTATITPTLDPAEATFITFTPSYTLDVTYTPRPTSTPSATNTPAPEGLELLALLAAQFTVLPPEIRYNPATQTALALAVTAQLQTSLAPTASATMGGIGDVPLATLPPSNPVICAAPPPAVISSVLSSDPALAAALGCPIGSSISLGGASQVMERGTMIYTAGAPGDIYAVTSDMRFRRVPDLWVSGVDPDSMGLTPPPGLLEPIRGFGKVWRENLDIQGSIGWGASGESGTTATILLFERGRAIYLPTVNQTFILINDVGMTDRGQWRSVIGGF